VRGANDRRDLAVAVHKVLGSAHLSRHRETGRAVKINATVHSGFLAEAIIVDDRILH
jgi:hypothetical protein